MVCDGFSGEGILLLKMDDPKKFSRGVYSLQKQLVDI